MCGICGYYGENVADRPLPLETLRHRGPDDRGTAAAAQFKLGHTRLAIIDLDNGSQPMWNEDHSLCLVFNGEIYNHVQLRAALQARHSFRTRSDTEVILHLFEAEGASAVTRLDGMFALAIAGPDELVLARDPLGIKPLYYQVNDENLFFASELKSFTDPQHPIRELPPGSVYGTVRGWQPYYWVPRDFEEEMSWEECLAGLRQRLAAAVRKRLMADVPLGCFLSGGLDSSIVTALARQALPELHTFSVATERGTDRDYARLAARLLGTAHHECLVKPAALWEALPEIIFALESFDQSLVRSAVANYFLARLAAEHVKVVLTGEGADELFAGYAYLDRFEDAASLNEELWRITRDLYRTNLQRVDRMTMAHGLEARVPFLDLEVVRWALRTPAAFKRSPAGISKWCLREAFKDELQRTDALLYRAKEKFGQGSGVTEILAELAAAKVADGGYRKELERGTKLRSKEEYYYFQIYCSLFGRESAAQLVGRSRS